MSPAARRLEAKSTAELVIWMRHYLGLTYKQVGILAGATTRTAQRWGNADEMSVPSGDRRAKVEQLRDLRRLLGSSFPNEDVALEWLHREVPLLGGRRPMDLLRHGDLGPVVEVLSGAHTGAFA